MPNQALIGFSRPFSKIHWTTGVHVSVCNQLLTLLRLPYFEPGTWEYGPTAFAYFRVVTNVHLVNMAFPTNFRHQLCFVVHCKAKSQQTLSFRPYRSIIYSSFRATNRAVGRFEWPLTATWLVTRLPRRIQSAKFPQHGKRCKRLLEERPGDEPGCS